MTYATLRRAKKETTEMQIQIKRGRHFNSGKDLFEIKFPGSNRWYTLHKRQIYLYTGFQDRTAEHFDLMRKLFNSLYEGGTLQVEARYFKVAKILALEVVGGEKA